MTSGTSWGLLAGRAFNCMYSHHVYCYNAAMNGGASYAISDLAEKSGISVRTLRYYLAQGLLPAPVRKGRLTRYPQSTLQRLLLLKRLRAAHMPLADIRERLDAMPDEEFRDPVLRGIERQLALSVGRDLPPATQPPDELGAFWSSPRMFAERPSRGRTQWERIYLEPGVELHVQRPLNRLASKRVDRLVGFARELAETDLGTRPAKTTFPHADALLTTDGS